MTDNTPDDAIAANVRKALFYLEGNPGEGAVAAGRSVLIGLLATLEATRPVAYPGPHDDCIATTPHYHDRPYRPGEWSADFPERENRAPWQGGPQ